MFKFLFALLISSFSTFVFADYCFTSVKNLATCSEKSLIASNAHLGSYEKFVNNKTAIQVILLNPKPLDLSLAQPGSPAYNQILQDRRNYVPTRAYTLKFKLNGNKYEKQVGPNSNCYFQGTYKESKETIEFHSTNLIGECTSNERAIGKFALGKATYRKISY
jgi:hypothetical protein